MKRRITLCANVPQRTDATSFYRAYGPLGDLRKRMDIELVAADSWDWALCKLVDVFFLQRPCGADELRFAELVKENGKKLWIDWDDDIFGIPISSLAYSRFARKDIRECIIKLLMKADVITVSTEYLGKRFKSVLGERSPRILVVPNALDDEMCANRPADGQPDKRQDIVLWRGTSSHHADLLEVRADLIAAVKENPDTRFMFWGYAPWFLLRDEAPWMEGGLAGEKNIGFIEAADLRAYFANVYRMRPRIVIKPLMNDVFNHSKSNISWLEAIYAGAVVVCRDWDEWQGPGTIRYGGKVSFKDALDKAMGMPADAAAKMNREAWRYIQKHLKLSTVNQLREDMIRGLAG